MFINSVADNATEAAGDLFGIGSRMKAINRAGTLRWKIERLEVLPVDSWIDISIVLD